MLEKLTIEYGDYIDIFLQAAPKIIMIIIGGFIIGRIGKKLLENIIRKTIKGEPELDEFAEKKREDTLIAILDGTFSVVLWIIVLLLILSELSVNIAPIIASAGVVGIAVGFGGQYLIKDVITGMFILLENQYRVGDIVNINSLAGSVEDITLRKTTLRSIDGDVHHIPHGEITMVTNMTARFSQVNIDFGISYESNIDTAIEVINQVGKEMFEDAEWKSFLIEPPYFKRVEDLADSAVLLKILAKTRPGKQFDVAGEIKYRIKKACDKAGISIPYPQMTIHQENK